MVRNAICKFISIAAGFGLVANEACAATISAGSHAAEFSSAGSNVILLAGIAWVMIVGGRHRI